MLGRGLKITGLASLASATLYSNPDSVHSSHVQHPVHVCQDTSPNLTAFSSSNHNNITSLRNVETSLVIHSETNKCVPAPFNPVFLSDKSVNVVDESLYPSIVPVIDNISNISSSPFTGPSSPPGPEIYQKELFETKDSHENSGTDAKSGSSAGRGEDQIDFRVYNADQVVRPNELGRQQVQQEKLKSAISKARDLCWCKMYEAGSPGMVVCISVNGKIVWQHGFGYSDLENRLLVGTGCIMRITSISKSLTMAVLAKLVEEGKVNLDDNISKYIPSWPEKIIEGEKVELTVRQLCSHMSGVRHYDKKDEDETSPEFDKKEYYLQKEFKSTEEALALFKDDALMSKPGTKFLYSTHGFTLLAAVIENVTGEKFDKYMKKQFRELGMNNTYLDENGPIIYNRSKYYVRNAHHRLKNAPYVDCSYKWAGGGFLSNAQDLTRFGNAMLYSYQRKPTKSEKSGNPNSSKALEPVPGPVPDEKADLKTESSPGTEADENIKEKSVPTLINQSIKPGDIKTCDNHANNNLTTSADSAEEADNEIYVGIEDVENSIAQDVVFQPGPFSAVNKQAPTRKFLPGYLKSETVQEMWKPVPSTKLGWGGEDLSYGLGWAVRPHERNHGFGKNQTFYACHTGGAIGASSVLLIAPSLGVVDQNSLPQGVVVSILCNLQGVGLNKLAVDIAKSFEGVITEKPVKVQKIYQC